MPGGGVLLFLLVEVVVELLLFLMVEVVVELLLAVCLVRLLLCFPSC